MVRYRIDGSSVATDVPLEGVTRADPGAPDWEIRIERGAPEDGWPAGMRVTGGCRGRGGVWAEFARDDASRAVVVRNWFRLIADPAQAVAVVRHAHRRSDDALVLRRVLPYLSSLRGRLVLHAACVVLPAGAVVFCADARTGKSTLALGLDAAGYPVLGDDHICLDVGGRGASLLAHASLPWVEVSARSVRALRPDVPPQRGEGPPIDLRTPRPARGVPVVGLVLLRRGRGLYRRRISGATFLPRLLRRYAFVGDPTDPTETSARFEAALRLVSRVPCTSLTVPAGLSRLNKSLARIGAWWGVQSTGGASHIPAGGYTPTPGA
jgi:hypothetical protein